MKYKLSADEKLFLSANLPTNQRSEVLFYLLRVSKVTTRLLFSDLGILNPTARISNLRAMGLVIECDGVKFVNKFGRPGKYGIYSLKNAKKGISVYKELIKHKSKKD